MSSRAAQAGCPGGAPGGRTQGSWGRATPAAPEPARRRRSWSLPRSPTVLVAVSSGGGSKPAAVPASHRSTLLGGLRSWASRSAASKAPITLVEFNDMQCPICRDYTNAVLPTHVNEYAAPGSLRRQTLPAQLVHWSRIRSPPAGGRERPRSQNRAWTFADIFYGHQGQEGSSYVTPDFVRTRIAAATPGLNHSELVRERARRPPVTRSSRAPTRSTPPASAARPRSSSAGPAGRCSR